MVKTWTYKQLRSRYTKTVTITVLSQGDGKANCNFDTTTKIIEILAPETVVGLVFYRFSEGGERGGSTENTRSL